MSSTKNCRVTFGNTIRLMEDCGAINHSGRIPCIISMWLPRSWPPKEPLPRVEICFTWVVRWDGINMSMYRPTIIQNEEYEELPVDTALASYGDASVGRKSPRPTNCCATVCLSNTHRTWWQVLQSSNLDSPSTHWLDRKRWVCLHRWALALDSIF